MKKYFNTVILMLVMTVGFSTMAFATKITPIQQVQNTLTQMGVPNTYVGNIVEYLQKVNITQSQVDKINGYIDEAIAIIGNTKDLSKLSINSKSQLQAIAVKAGSVVGLSVSFGKDAKGVTTFVVTDGNGKTILSLNTFDVLNLVTNFDISHIRDILKAVVDFSNNADKGKYDPISGELNNTATNNGNIMLVGFGMMALAGVVYLGSKKSLA